MDPADLTPPQPPVEPEPWQCCGSGCDPCVYDRYWEALERYEEAYARWLEQTTATPSDAATAHPEAGRPDPSQFDNDPGSP